MKYHLSINIKDQYKRKDTRDTTCWRTGKTGG
jgi:hypothetical protein